MNEKTNSKQRRGNSYLLVFFLIVVLVSYFVLQISTFLAKDVKLGSARKYSTEDKFSTDIFIIKKEKVVIANTSGECDYLVSEGSKISSGEKIAVVYENFNNTELINKIKKLDLELETIKELIETSSTFDYDVTRLDLAIDSSVNAILDSVDDGNVSGSMENMTNLRKYINKRSLLNSNYSLNYERMNEIENEIQQIVDDNSSSVKPVFSPSSGFFCSLYDGLEEKTSYEDIVKMSVNDFNELMNYSNQGVKPKGYIGTIVNGFSWRGAFKVPAGYSLEIDDEINIRLPNTSNEIISATVEHISDISSSEKIVIVSSKNDLQVLTGNRIQSVEIIEKIYTGLRVPNEAVKTIDNQLGLFVLKGRILDFVEVNVEYSTDEFAIVNEIKKNTLFEDDDIVVSGKNLYDGKVVNTLG